jgi:hypothetical protein
MHYVESNLRMELDCFFVSQPEPEHVMDLEPPVMLLAIPSVEESRDVQPMKPQVLIWMSLEEFLDSVLVMRICQNPDLMMTRKVPRPVPSETWL